MTLHTVTIPADQSVHVDGDSPTTNYGSGSYPMMYVSWEWHYPYEPPLGAMKISYIKFDLSTIPKNINVTSAIMYVRCNTALVNPLTVDAFQLVDDWDKDLVTYNTKPATVASPTDNEFVDTSGALYHWDITTDIKADLAFMKTTPLYTSKGHALIARSSPYQGGIDYFYRNTDPYPPHTDYTPYLVVTYWDRSPYPQGNYPTGKVLIGVLNNTTDTVELGAGTGVDVSKYIKKFAANKCVKEIHDCQITLENTDNKFTSSDGATAASVWTVEKDNWIQVFLGDGIRGIASLVTNNTLTDYSYNWTTNQYEEYYVEIIRGTGLGQIRRIESNTDNTLTVYDDWDTNPDDTSMYVIHKLVYEGSVYDKNTTAQGFKNLMTIHTRSFTQSLTKRLISCLNSKRFNETFYKILTGEAVGTADGYGNYPHGILYNIGSGAWAVYTNKYDFYDGAATISADTNVDTIEQYEFKEGDTIFNALTEKSGYGGIYNYNVYVKRNRINATAYYLCLYFRPLTVPLATNYEFVLDNDGASENKIILKNGLKKTISGGDITRVTVSGSKQLNLKYTYDDGSAAVVEKPEVTAESIKTMPILKDYAIRIYNDEHAERLEGQLECPGVNTYMIEPDDIVWIVDPGSQYPNSLNTTKNYYRRIERHILEYTDDVTGMKLISKFEVDKGQFRMGRYVSNLTNLMDISTNFRSDVKQRVECAITNSDELVLTEYLNDEHLPTVFSVHDIGTQYVRIDFDKVVSSPYYHDLITPSVPSEILSFVSYHAAYRKVGGVFTVDSTAHTSRNETAISVNVYLAGTYDIWVQTIFSFTRNAVSQAIYIYQYAGQVVVA